MCWHCLCRFWLGVINFTFYSAKNWTVTNFVLVFFAVPLMVLLSQNKILNVASIVLSLCVMVIFLFIGIFNGKFQIGFLDSNILNFNQILFWTADISNWKNSLPNASGFFAYGADGVLRGIIVILFIFVAFDIMMMSPSVDFIGLPIRTLKPSSHRKIRYFGQTIERTIFLINTILCLCLVGMALALTIVQPIQLMVCKVDEFEFEFACFTARLAHVKTPIIKCVNFVKICLSSLCFRIKASLCCPLLM